MRWLRPKRDGKRQQIAEGFSFVASENGLVLQSPPLWSVSVLEPLRKQMLGRGSTGEVAGSTVEEAGQTVPEVEAGPTVLVAEAGSTAAARLPATSDLCRRNLLPHSRTWRQTMPKGIVMAPVWS